MKNDTTKSRHLMAEARRLYRNGVNVMDHIRQHHGQNVTLGTAIELSYEAQAGSYVEALNDPTFAALKGQYAAAIAGVLAGLDGDGAVLEAGVGEATTLSGVAQRLGQQRLYYGFDISWSRLIYARAWLERAGGASASLCVADLLNAPYVDNAFDIVYTSHSVEPNGGQEKVILAELLRLARTALVLVEPAYEFAGLEARARMERLNYCRDLAGHLRALGAEILMHRPFDISVNPLNPTGLIIARKPSSHHAPKVSPNIYRCPITHTPLVEEPSMFASVEGLLCYPVLRGVPCLRTQDAFMAAALDDPRLSTTSFVIEK
jgi:hypothetical protein